MERSATPARTPRSVTHRLGPLMTELRAKERLPFRFLAWAVPLPLEEGEQPPKGSKQAMLSIETIRQRAESASVGMAVLFTALLFLLPFINPIHRLPLPTFDSECLAALLLASSLIVLLFAAPNKARLHWPLPTVLVLMLAIAAYQYIAGQLSYSYQLATLALAVLGILAAYALGRWFVTARLAERCVTAICAAIVAGAAISHIVQWMQILDIGSLPFWLYFPMERERPFRAVANLGQANQLAAYFSMGLVALLYLRGRGWPSVAVLGLAPVMASGVALTQSRMGILMIVLLAAACIIGPLRSLAGQRRWVVGFWAAAAIGYVLAWVFGPLLATSLDKAIAPDALLSQSTAKMRLVMWADAWRVIQSAPLLGVGAGQYADAQYWVAGASQFTLGTPYVHNVLLQVAAEFGAPIGLCLLALILWWTLAKLRQRLADPTTATAWALGLLILVHSLLEWPLWVFFVAVPAGLLFGLAEPDGRGGATMDAKRVLAPVGLAALLYTSLMILDYDRVSVASQLLYREQAIGKRASLEAQMAVLQIGDATFFKPQMDRQILSLLSPRKPVEDHDIELTRRVLSRLPDDRVIARYITLLALDGKIDEAIRNVDRMRVFSSSTERYDQAEKIVLKGIATEGPQLDPLRQRLTEARP